jgi:G3E family GTPase
LNPARGSRGTGVIPNLPLLSDDPKQGRASPSHHGSRKSRPQNRDLEAAGTDPYDLEWLKAAGNDFDSSLGSQHDVSIRNFLGEDDHQHDDAITSVALRQEGAIDINKFNAWISALLRTRGQDILRSKGILNIKGSPDRFVFQAVHMLMEGDDGKRWRPGEPRDSKLVFIGRNLDPAELRSGFGACLAA